MRSTPFLNHSCCLMIYNINIIILFKKKFTQTIGLEQKLESFVSKTSAWWCRFSTVDTECASFIFIPIMSTQWRPLPWVLCLLWFHWMSLSHLSNQIIFSKRNNVKMCSLRDYHDWKDLGEAVLRSLWLAGLKAIH